MNYYDDQQTARITAAGRSHGTEVPPEQKWFNPSAPAVGVPARMPSANGGWAVTTVLFFWPLAFMAFSRALSVPTLLALGRVQEAQVASDSVARLGKIALIVGVLIIILVVTAEVALLRDTSSLAVNSHYRYSGN